jgi:hypothetical protein
MRVDESRSESASLTVNKAGRWSLKRESFLIRADENYSFAAHRDCLGARIGFAAGKNAGIVHNEIGGLHNISSRCECTEYT